MEKAAAEPRSDGREVQCVGRLEIVRPRPLGFLCGSIPVPTARAFLHSFSSALVPSPQILRAPRYRELPPATDLNTLPVVLNFPEKVPPVGAVQSKAAGELPWPGEAIQANFNRKCDVLALSGLVERGDEIDVIAPADILKQIFKIPYSKCQLSIAVRRVGQTLVLSSGPNVEEGEQMVRRQTSQANCADHSLFSNFAMHSFQMEACDCPPTYKTSTEGQSNSFLSAGSTSQTVGQCHDAGGDKISNNSSYSQVKQESLQLGTNSTQRNKDRHPIPKSEKHRRVGDDGFLRVLFWQFHNFRVLLGSDMLIFSNDKNAAVSPLTWLEAWLDNVMASLPELAICYHQNGVVNRYAHLKTDQILREVILDDGFPAFNPHVIQQNGLYVLRFLQENCKQDPGAYWLYKSVGDEVIQLFDLSAIPKNYSNDSDESTSSLHSLVHGSRSDSLLSLGTLLLCIAHRMSLSSAPKNQAKCASFFRKCLEVLDEPDHLVVHALAHEQFARLLLSHEGPAEINLESLPVAYEVSIPEESLDNVDGGCESLLDEQIMSIVAETAVDGEKVCKVSSLEL